jgi:hypothetical protein
MAIDDEPDRNCMTIPRLYISYEYLIIQRRERSYAVLQKRMSFGISDHESRSTGKRLPGSNTIVITKVYERGHEGDDGRPWCGPLVFRSWA